ncbi:uncharacterized protein AMSG_07797 [Thecamonas trahens ATCC 50062]|uniref:ZZ-type domain-containing protein n=1 Tax=Thecamonas trahens ATCC 50062 TaxID=461836 RepID=A0A0L0DK39_THETB|nr:hypothetical protein AMSG_07797 [Thecamonas trahens ATCC 50062]KNC51728.1 hypothetical protein AMSG_07797 [Thecamonas trahens ATCC 50062]|eukprot:XP_013755857.1 hypothetical protein AMSG_07797 [Thecamonas trahens ATCC 50062]
MSASPPSWNAMSEDDQKALLDWFQTYIQDCPFSNRVMLVATQILCVLPGTAVASSDAGASSSASASSAAAGASSSTAAEADPTLPEGAKAEIRAESFLALQGIISAEETDARDALIDALAERVEEVEDRLDVVLEPGTAIPVQDASVTILTSTSATTGTELPLREVAAREGHVSLITFATALSPIALGTVHGLVQFVAKAAAEWDGKVDVVCVWLDDQFKPAELAEQIESNGWAIDGLTHVWAGPDGPQSDLAEAFAVTRMPLCFLTDTQGRLAWQGVSGALDFGVEIAALLDGSEALLETWKTQFHAFSVAAIEDAADCGCCGDEEAAAPKTESAPACDAPKWMDAAPTEDVRVAKLCDMFKAASAAELAFDSFISQVATLVSADGVTHDARVSVAGEFPSSAKAELDSAMAAMTDIAGCRIDTAQITMFATAAPLDVAAACSACAKPSAVEGSDEPAFTCVHCAGSSEPITLCAKCYWTTAPHDPSHTFVATLRGRTQLHSMRHGNGTLLPENPADTDDVVEGMHVTVQCDGCAVNPLALVRYKCAHCEDYDLCADCHASWAASADGVISTDDGFTYAHAPEHAFLAYRADQPSSA